MSKNAVIVYYSEWEKYYEKKWIDKFIDSILNQTCQDFDIIELDYGIIESEPLFQGLRTKSINTCRSVLHLPTHANALNSLLDECLSDNNYDYVFNTNIDDWYGLNRVEVQLKILEQGYDIVSSNFYEVRNGICVGKDWSVYDIQSELAKDHNILCHPVIAYSRAFWKRGAIYRPEEIPIEDLRLWQKEINRNKFYICPEFLCYHRVHSNSIAERMK